MKPVVICLSGKRKCGKDFVAGLLAKRLNEIGYEVIICGVSHPLKEEYARLNGLDEKLLKSDGLYKEKYRQEMVNWGEKIRNGDPGYFCRKVLSKSSSADVLIVPDCRRVSDIEFFKKHCDLRLRLVRIESNLTVRELRGFKFVKGIDDKITECGLDEFDKWDFVICNDIQVMNHAIPSGLDENISGICFQVCDLINEI